MKFAAAILVTAALTTGAAFSIAAPARAYAAADQTQSFSTSAGPVKITPIYHAAARITAGNDVIVIDPAPPAKIDGVGPADLILITDIHGDHMNADDVKALSKDGTVVIAPASVAKTITQAKVIGNGDTTTFHKWKITAVPMYNISH